MKTSSAENLTTKSSSTSILTESALGRVLPVALGLSVLWALTLSFLGS